MIYRNVYVKGHSDGKIPASLFRGMRVLRYSGSIRYGVCSTPRDYDGKRDLFINCDCFFEGYHSMKKIVM